MTFAFAEDLGFPLGTPLRDPGAPPFEVDVEAAIPTLTAADVEAAGPALTADETTGGMVDGWVLGAGDVMSPGVIGLPISGRSGKHPF